MEFRRVRLLMCVSRDQYVLCEFTQFSWDGKIVERTVSSFRSIPGANAAGVGQSRLT